MEDARDAQLVGCFLSLLVVWNVADLVGQILVEVIVIEEDSWLLRVKHNWFLLEDDHGLMLGGHGLCLGHNWLFDQDVAPDLMAETYVLTEGHPEVSAVLSFGIRSLQVQRPVVLTISGNDRLENGGVGTKIVTVCLNQDDIFGPGSGAVVAHGPRLFEGSSRGNFVHVSDAFFHKASLVGDLVSLRRLTADGTCAHLLFILVFWSGLLSVLVLVLADQLRRGMLGFTHLEQRVMRVDSSLLAVLAEIEVSADRAHVTNTTDG